MTGPFAQAAMVVARYGAVPVPCAGPDGKTPLVPWRHVKAAHADGLARWAKRWPTANIGLVCGPSNLTVIDVDDPALVDEAERRFGSTPLIDRSPRGGGHLFYRANGEPTRAKIDGLPIDVRGPGGFLVIPPSVGPNGNVYAFVRGGLADLEHLPHITPGSLPAKGTVLLSLRNDAICPGTRNNSLWRLCMVEARTCATRDELEARALILNESHCNPPLDHREAVKVVNSAWRYQITGQNFIGGERRVFMEITELERLAGCPDAVLMLLKLREAHLLSAEPFAVSPKGMSAARVLARWDARRIRRARNHLLNERLLVQVRAGGRGKHDPSLYVLKGTELLPNITYTLNPLSAAQAPTTASGHLKFDGSGNAPPAA